MRSSSAVLIFMVHHGSGLEIRRVGLVLVAKTWTPPFDWFPKLFRITLLAMPLQQFRSCYFFPYTNIRCVSRPGAVYTMVSQGHQFFDSTWCADCFAQHCATHKVPSDPFARAPQDSKSVDKHWQTIMVYFTASVQPSSDFLRACGWPQRKEFFSRMLVIHHFWFCCFHCWARWKSWFKNWFLLLAQKWKVVKACILWRDGWSLSDRWLLFYFD